MSRFEGTPEGVGGLHQLRPSATEMARPDLNVNPDLIDAQEWKKDTPCKEKQELFFPERGYVTEKVSKAKSLCASCVVQAACADYAIENNEPDGIWGGLTADERKGIRRAQKQRAS